MRISRRHEDFAQMWVLKETKQKLRELKKNERKSMAEILKLSLNFYIEYGQRTIQGDSTPPRGGAERPSEEDIS